MIGLQTENNSVVMLYQRVIQDLFMLSDSHCTTESEKDHLFVHNIVAKSSEFRLN